MQSACRTAWKRAVMAASPEDIPEFLSSLPDYVATVRLFREIRVNSMCSAKLWVTAVLHCRSPTNLQSISWKGVALISAILDCASLKPPL